MKLSGVWKITYFKILKDGDIGGVFGVGFLPWSGGPFSYMNLLGLDHVVERMEHYASIHGPKFNPRPLLKIDGRERRKVYCLTINFFVILKFARLY